MSATAGVTERIRASLLDLERTLEHDTVIEIARAVFVGACAAFYELSLETAEAAEVHAAIVKNVFAALPELGPEPATRH